MYTPCVSLRRASVTVVCLFSFVVIGTYNSVCDKAVVGGATVVKGVCVVAS